SPLPPPPPRLAPILFAKPRLVGTGFMGAPRIPIVADVDGDGFADLIAVSPLGTGAVEVAPNVRGGKFAAPESVASGFGPIVSASARPGGARRAEIVGTKADGERCVVRRAADGSWSVAHEDPSKSTPPPPPSPGDAPNETLVVTGEFDGDGVPDRI